MTKIAKVTASRETDIVSKAWKLLAQTAFLRHKNKLIAFILGNLFFKSVIIVIVDATSRVHEVGNVSLAGPGSQHLHRTAMFHREHTTNSATSTPVSVTTIVCSNCADNFPSCTAMSVNRQQCTYTGTWVTLVQLSGQVWSPHTPSLIIGSIVKQWPGFITPTALFFA